MPSAPPPSPQEITRKLSVHSAPKTTRPITESDLENVADAVQGLSAGSSQPLSVIAERPDVSGGDDSEEDEDEEGGWKSSTPIPQNSKDEGVIRAGYLWKKGERRKTWKKRWFVLRPAHLAYYKTAAEYQLLRLLELSDVHSCSKVALKKHENTFGLVSPVRTFYLQAKSPEEVAEWVTAIEGARQDLMATSTQNSASTPIPIPGKSASHSPLIQHTPSPPSHHPSAIQNATSSDSEDASPSDRVLATTPMTTSPSKPQAAKDPGKTILSGYLMKCGSKRRNWRKRWFVLTGEKLMYSASHMDTKPHRQFAFSEIVDAFETDLPSHRHNPPPAATSPTSDNEPGQESHTFKIITTKRTLLLCAPGEEEEIKWLGAVRALIARRSTSDGGKSGTGSSSVGADTSPSSSGFTSAGSSGIKSKSSRRLSATAPTTLTNVIIEEESAQEK